MLNYLGNDTVRPKMQNFKKIIFIPVLANVTAALRYLLKMALLGVLSE